MIFTIVNVVSNEFKITTTTDSSHLMFRNHVLCN